MKPRKCVPRILVPHLTYYDLLQEKSRNLKKQMLFVYSDNCVGLIPYTTTQAVCKVDFYYFRKNICRLFILFLPFVPDTANILQINHPEVT